MLISLGDDRSSRASHDRGMGIHRPTQRIPIIQTIDRATQAPPFVSLGAAASVGGVAGVGTAAAVWLAQQVAQRLRVARSKPGRPDVVSLLILIALSAAACSAQPTATGITADNLA